MIHVSTTTHAGAEAIESFTTTADALAAFEAAVASGAFRTVVCFTQRGQRLRAFDAGKTTIGQ